MKFIIYGIKIDASIVLPLHLPISAQYTQTLRLEVNKVEYYKKHFLYQTPVVEIHGRKIQLSSTEDFSQARNSKTREWKIRIEDLFDFVWLNGAKRVRIEYSQTLDKQKLSFWLLHTMIPIYLMLQQESIMLHASAVEVNQAGILFLAPSFGGKSTLADFFVTKGHKLLSDDKIRLHNQEHTYSLYASYPYRRTYRENESLGSYSEAYEDKSIALSGLYVLVYVAEESECSVSVLEGLAKFESLKNAYLYEPVSMSKIELTYLMHLSQVSSVYQVTVPKTLKRLEEVYQCIVAYEKRKNIGIDNEKTSL